MAPPLVHLLFLCMCAVRRLCALARALVHTSTCGLVSPIELLELPLAGRVLPDPRARADRVLRTQTRRVRRRTVRENPCKHPTEHSEAKKKAYVRVGSTLRLYAMANHPSVSGFGLLVHRMGCSAQGSKMLTDTSSLPTLGLTSHHQVRVRVRARARTRPLLGSPSAAIHLSTIFS